MKHYVEAYQADGSQILGNLDGQAVLHAKDPRRTKHFKRLESGQDRPTHSRVYRWRVEPANGGKPIFILNKWRNVL